MMTADEVIRKLQDSLDGIEMLDNVDREQVMNWADRRCAIGMWGVPGTEILIGIHNKCVVECRNDEPSWNKADIIVV